MKRTKRIWALLMTLALVLTYMPVVAFAEDGEEGAAPVEVQEEAVAEAAEDAEPAAIEEIVVDEEQPEVAEVEATAEEAAPKEAANAAAKPVSIDFKVAEPLECYVGNREVYFDYEEAILVVKYSDTTKTYKYIGYDESTGHEYYAFYEDGNPSKSTLDGDVWVQIDAENGAVEGSNAGTVVYETSDGTRVTKTITVTGVVDQDIKSARYIRNGNKAAEIKYENGYADWGEDWSFLKGDRIVLEYYTEVENYNEEEDDYYYENALCKTTYVFDPDEEECSFAYESGDRALGWDVIRPELTANVSEENWLPGNSYNVNVYVYGFKAEGGLTVSVKGAPVPTNVEFVPAAGFTPEGYIGDTYLDEEAFAGKGNSFIVTYSDGHKDTYKYITIEQNNTWWEGFYLNGDKNGKRLSAGASTSALKKGNNTVTFTYWESIDGYEYECSVDFKADVVANKYYVYADFRTYPYTGKAITPKVVVRNADGKALPATAYTYKAVKGKNIGYYDFEVNMKDTDNYPATIWCTYAITPKAAAIKSVKAGKKSFTVKWKKFSKKDQKNIDGFYIEYSTDKNFKNSKLVKASKKSASKTIKKLGAKKTYYVRVYTYKKVKQDGESFIMDSKVSKTKKVKTK